MTFFIFGEFIFSVLSVDIVEDQYTGHLKREFFFKLIQYEENSFS